ncbi:MAG: roadblock/LC7 domain-containing protein [Gemmatimonadales bacterium]
MAFRDLLDQWDSRPAIRGGAVISEDGLLVHDLLADGVDGEALAALAVVLRRDATQLSDAAGGGDPGTLVVELPAGPVVVAGLDEHHTLLLLARPGADIGPLLYDIRCHRTTLSRAV